MERLAARQQRLGGERQLKLPDEHTLKTSLAFTKYREGPKDFIEHIEGSSQLFVDDESNTRKAEDEDLTAEDDF